MKVLLKTMLKSFFHKKDNLIGLWKSDPFDEVTQLLYGNVIMEFKDNGDLVYTVFSEDGKQIINMTYEINRDLIVTNQVSLPNRTETRFILSKDLNVLELILDNISSRFVRVYSE